MDYLVYVAGFGAAATVFLWLRDARIFFRTGLPGYRKAAYWGVGYGALATLGIFFTFYSLELLGLGLILGALYLQGNVQRERIWGNESTFERFIGSAPRPKANKR